MKMRPTEIRLHGVAELVKNGNRLTGSAQISSSCVCLRLALIYRIKHQTAVTSSKQSCVSIKTL